MDQPPIARSPGEAREPELARRLAAADFQIVDCRLPPRIRRLGTQRVYLEPQRPVRTTGRDCGIRGGDAVVFDPSNYATALAIWLPLAEEGDPKAQTYVGDIYERGLTGSPDYEQAAEWYRRAADQGYASAQISLGQLYERGLGVSEDRTRAMNLYRQASGLEAPLEIVDAGELQDLRARAAESDREAEQLSAQLEDLEEELRRTRAEQPTLQAEGESLEREQQALREQQRELETERRTLRAERDALERERQALLAEARGEAAEQIQRQIQDVERREEELVSRQGQIDIREDALVQRETDLASKEREVQIRENALVEREQEISQLLSSLFFGHYYALVIGNEEYGNGIDELPSARLDADAVSETLTNRYGFDVFLLRNATRRDILDALNTLKDQLTQDDNLLIYYAGHGKLDGDRGYWLPVDAEPEPYTTNWISADDVVSILERMDAKQVIVIADSCYSGSFVEATPQILAWLPYGDEYINWLKTVARQPARMSLTSGDLEPVLSGGGGAHSVFASAFIEELGTNTVVMEGWRLYLHLAAKLADAERTAGIRQTPTYRVIQSERHRGGDFFFVPKEENPTPQQVRELAQTP